MDNSSANLVRVIADIRKKEYTHHFLTDFIERNGMPLWAQTISSVQITKSNTPGVSRQLNGEMETATEIAPEIYFIPLIDQASNEIKSYIFCAKNGDSSYSYKIYNRNEILATRPKNRTELNNGISELAVFAAFENRINNKKTTVHTYPYGYRFENEQISFRFNNSIYTKSVNSRIASTGNQKRVNDGCEEIRKGWLYLGGFVVEIVYAQNTCTGQTAILQIVWPGGNSGGTNPSPSNPPTPNNPPPAPPSNEPPPTYTGGYDFGGANVPGYDPALGVGTGIEANTYWSNSGLADPFIGGTPDIPTDAQDPNNYYSPLAGTTPVITSLQTQLQLNVWETDYLNQNKEAANALYNELQDEDDEDGTGQDAYDAAKASIDIEMYGMGNGPFDQTYVDIIWDWHQGMRNLFNLFNGTTFAQKVAKYSNAYTTNYQIAKRSNPNQHPVVLGYKAIKPILQVRQGIQNLQTNLDYIALYPGTLGGIADLLNTSIYLASGNFREAELRFHSSLQGSLVGGNGWASSGAVIAIKGEVQIIKLENDIFIWTRNQKAARTALGLTPHDGYIAHHLLPFALGSHPVIQKAAMTGFHINDFENLKKIEKALHKGSHKNYSDKVRARLDFINTSNPNMDPQQAQSAIQALINEIANAIESHPGVKIDNIPF